MKQVTFDITSETPELTFSTVGIPGPQGKPGDDGKDFEYGDFTPEQLTALKGEKGDAFLFSDFTPEQLISITGPQGDSIKGDKGDPGGKGDKGDGFTYADMSDSEKEDLRAPLKIHFDSEIARAESAVADATGARDTTVAAKTAVDAALVEAQAIQTDVLGKSTTIQSQYDGVMQASATITSQAATVESNKNQVEADKLEVEADKTASESAKVAAEAAKVAAEAAAVTANAALVYEGTWDASTGAYPANQNRNGVWKVVGAGTVSGTAYVVGDELIWSKDRAAFERAPSGSAITSINGKVSGDVVLTASDVGALTESQGDLKYLGINAQAKSAAVAGTAALAGKLTSANKANIKPSTSGITTSAAALITLTNNSNYWAGSNGFSDTMLFDTGQSALSGKVNALVFRKDTNALYHVQGDFNSGTWGTPAKVFTDADTPTAQDVGALPITGGTLQGDLGLNGHKLDLGDSKEISKTSGVLRLKNGDGSLLVKSSSSASGLVYEKAGQEYKVYTATDKPTPADIGAIALGGKLPFADVIGFPSGVLNQAAYDARYLQPSGTAAYANKLARDRTNYAGQMEGAVVGQLGWSKYGNNHTIFDASASKGPGGESVSLKDSDNPWSDGYPTLMGWNGTNTFGVRVDSSRTSDTLEGSTKAQVISQALAGKSADTTLFDGKSSTDFRKVSEGGLKTIHRGQFNTVNGYKNAFIARLATNTSQWSEQGPLIVELYNKYYNKGGYKKYLVQFGYKSAAARVVLVEAFGDSGKERLFAEAPVVISGTTRYVDIKLNTDKYSQTVIVIKTCATYNSNKNTLAANQIYCPPMGDFAEEVTTSFTPDEDLTVDRTLTTVGNLYERSNRVYSAGNKPSPADIGALPANSQAKDSALFGGRPWSVNETGDTAVMRTAAGDINTRLFKSTFGTQSSMPVNSDICFRIESGTGNADNYMRFVSKTGFKTWLGRANDSARFLGKTLDQVKTETRAGLISDTRTVNNKRLNSNITITKADVGLGNTPNYGPTNSATGTSTTLLATQKAAYEASSAPRLADNRKRPITQGTSTPSGGSDGDIYIQI